MTRSAHPAPHKRRGYWYLARKVPKRFRHLDKRVVILLTTNIPIPDDPRGIAARVAVQQLSDELESEWRQLAGEPEDPKIVFARSVKIVDRHGIPYLETPKVAELPHDEFYGRLDILKPAATVDNVTAILGGAPKPAFMVSGLLAEFEAAQATLLIKKSPRQLKKWRNERDGALKSFIIVIGGDKPVTELSLKDAHAWQDHWKVKATAKEGRVKVHTANRNISRVAVMVDSLNTQHRLQMPKLFQDLYLPGDETGQRIAFDLEFIQNVLLADGRLNGLNHEARRILYAMVETGLRISEVCSLTKSSIILDHPVPHVLVTEEFREAKTKDSVRPVPLVGVSLMAFQAQPEGFPTYFDKNATVSATVNKFLRENKLLPNGETLYSIRHSFEDRLTAVEAPEKVVASLMGHKWYRPKYGKGPSLEQKAHWLNEIAFRPPLTV
jgi:integrase